MSLYIFQLTSPRLFFPPLSRTDVIVEVLSPATEAYDRGDKFRKYRSLPSFCEYLLVSQTEPYIEQYFRLELVK